MKTVMHILGNKPKDIFFVSPHISVLEGLQVMMEKNISALLVMENGKLEGIFTERDYARKIVLQGKSSKETPISNAMTANLLTLLPTDSIDHCMQTMTDKHIRHLPVVEDGKVSGLISIGDVVKYVIEDQKKTIEQLESYINS